MKSFYHVIPVLLLLMSCSNSGSKGGFDKKLTESTTWRFNLKINDSYSVPFLVSLDSMSKSSEIVVHNAEERIVVKDFFFSHDSLFIDMPFFHNQIFASYNSEDDTYTGYMPVKVGDSTYQMELMATRSNKLFDKNKVPLSETLKGDWRTLFTHGDGTFSEGVTLLRPYNDSTVQGTVMKTTGDYRFLHGVTTEDSLFLSCFDGSHCFLFAAKIDADTISGTFFSKAHSQRDFKMWRDPLFALPKADTLTYLVDGSDDLHLEIPEKNYTFPNESTEGKVQILQIMGTWCPNCMDESRYLVEVYEKYKGQDLAITGFCFERGATPELRQEIVDGYQKNMSIPYKLIEAGSLRANAASQVFNQLNHIMSYPTLIVVDKTGKVAKIHTGFSGPATGEVYVEYVNEMDALLEELLAE